MVWAAIVVVSTQLLVLTPVMSSVLARRVLRSRKSRSVARKQL
jgi:hypothetical protein